MQRKEGDSMKNITCPFCGSEFSTCEGCLHSGVGPKVSAGDFEIKGKKEIVRLKEMLEKAGIPFEYDEDSLVMQQAQLCYPQHDPRYRECSVIQGPDSYGGRSNKLEILGLLTKEEKQYDCVAGWLSAEEVFDRINRHWEAAKKWK